MCLRQAVNQGLPNDLNGTYPCRSFGEATPPHTHDPAPPYLRLSQRSLHTSMPTNSIKGSIDALLAASNITPPVKIADVALCRPETPSSYGRSSSAR